MSTPNFKLLHANQYYVIYDGENYYENEMRLEDITESLVTELNFKKFEKDTAIKTALDTNLAYSNNFYNFGKTKNLDLQTCISIIVGLNFGHYSGATLDFDIQFTTFDGEKFVLSQYHNNDDFIDDYLDILGESVAFYNSNKWNRGTFKFQKKNIRKWLQKHLQKAIEEANNICKQYCDGIYGCVAIFSNGEAIYQKVTS